MPAGSKDRTLLQAHELRKSYGAREVVAGVSFSAAPGEILGLLGPNGAGKTTIVSMLCGLVAPESGSIAIEGKAIQGDTSDIKRRIGLVPQDLALYEDLSARGNLELFGALYGISGAKLHERCNQALDLVGLRDRAKDKPRTFSGGMQRRLNIACALVHDPDLLLLDEPTVGVDPQSRNAIFDNLQTLKARGKTLVYTTHYMEEAERLCDRVVIIDHGKVVASDTLQGLYRLLPAVESLEIEVEGSVDATALSSEPGVKSVEQTNGKLFIGVNDLALAAPIVLAWLAAHGHTVHRFASARATLENVFLALTGRQLRD
jgi:ABC-2 type transport system ATP-binding protein